MAVTEEALSLRKPHFWFPWWHPWGNCHQMCGTDLRSAVWTDRRTNTKLNIRPVTRREI